MIPGVAIQEGQHRTPGDRVYHLVYSGKSEGILQTVLVEIRIVDTHAPIHFILFEYKNRIC
jgi:hypothetical protein